jgi:glutamate synthase (NADPH/NADH) small chain
MAQEEKPVTIGMLQRYATDWLFEVGIQPFTRAAETGRRVAVIGAGPAGLSCAHALARLGHSVTVFERRAKAGGLNEYGIAAYKVPHDFAQREVDFILGVGGIELRCGVELGRGVTLPQLRQEYDAVFIGCGLQGVNALGLPQETMEGVIDAVDYIAALRQADDKARLPIGRDVVVIGGGNTAVDIAIQTRRLGAENVTIVYRRGAKEMGATSYEQELAQTNGVKIKYWARPVRLLGNADAHVTAIELEATALDAQGRLAGTGHHALLRADQVFKAIGQQLVPTGLDGAADLIELEGGKIRVNEERQTSLSGVWAGGDAVKLGQDLTVSAVEDGKIAARSIHAQLMGS